MAWDAYEYGVLTHFTLFYLNLLYYIWPHCDFSNTQIYYSDHTFGSFHNWMPPTHFFLLSLFQYFQPKISNQLTKVDLLAWLFSSYHLLCADSVVLNSYFLSAITWSSSTRWHLAVSLGPGEHPVSGNGRVNIWRELFYSQSMDWWMVGSVRSHPSVIEVSAPPRWSSSGVSFPGPSLVSRVWKGIVSQAHGFSMLSFSTGRFLQLPLCTKESCFKDLIKGLIMFVALFRCPARYSDSTTPSDTSNGR